MGAVQQDTAPLGTAPEVASGQRCTVCGAVLPLIAFSRDRSRTTGYRPQCKACVKTARATYVVTPPPFSAKACSACGIVQPLSAYYRQPVGSHGYRANCKACCLAARQVRPAHIAPGPEKRCRSCAITRPLAQFARERGTADGHNAQCKVCNRACYMQRSELLLARARERRAAARALRELHRRQEHEARLQALHQAGVKRCTRCGLCCSLSQFYTNRVAVDGLTSWCKGCLAQTTRERVEANRAAYRARKQARWQARTAQERQEIAARRRRARASNPVHYHLKSREYGHRRRARLVAAGGSFRAADVLLLYAQQSGLCAYCGRSVGELYHVDHKIPLSRGGTNAVANLCVTCPWCNLSKGARTDAEFRIWRQVHGLAP